MNQDRAKAFAEKLAAIKQNYIDHMHAYRADLERFVVPCATNALTDEQRVDLRMITHRLLGGGASFGFEEVSNNARVLELMILQQPQLRPDVLVPPMNDLLNACRDVEKQASHTPMSAHMPAVVGDSKKVLIVDDDDELRELVSVKLEAAGYIPSCARNGNVAWDMLLAYHFDLVLLDCIMPGYDGMALLNMIRQADSLKQVPVVFVTSKDMGSAVLDGLSSGANAYITKPFDVDALVESCEQWIAGKKHA